MNLGKLNPINLIHREVKPMATTPPTPGEIANVEAYLAANPTATPGALKMVETVVPAGTQVSVGNAAPQAITAPVAAAIPASVPLVQAVHTAVATPAAVAAAPAPKVSLGTKIKNDFNLLEHWAGLALKGLDTVALPIAEVAQPFVAIWNPAIGALMQSGILLVVKEEAAAKAAAQTGTGTTKLANVVTALLPVATQLVPGMDNVQLQQSIQLLVDLLKSPLFATLVPAAAA